MYAIFFPSASQSSTRFLRSPSSPFQRARPCHSLTGARLLCGVIPSAARDPGLDRNTGKVAVCGSVPVGLAFAFFSCSRHSSLVTRHCFTLQNFAPQHPGLETSQRWAGARYQRDRAARWGSSILLGVARRSSFQRGQIIQHLANFIRVLTVGGELQVFLQCLGGAGRWCRHLAC